MKNFLTKYSGLTHSLATLWMLAVGAFTGDAGFRQMVIGDAMAVYHSLPPAAAKMVAAVFALGVSLWGFYRNGQKGTSVTAQVLPGQTGAAEAIASVSKQAGMGMVTALLCSTLLLGATLPMTGCGAATTASEVNAILTEAQSLVSLAEPNATWLPAFQSAVTAAEKADVSWGQGGPVGDVDTALNTLLAVTATIPLSSKVTNLIDVLVAGIEFVLPLLVPSPATSTTPAGMTATPAALAMMPRMVLVGQAKGSSAKTNPHVGRVVIKHHFYRSHMGEFKAEWKKAVAQFKAK